MATMIDRQQVVGDLVETPVGVHRALTRRAPGCGEAAGGLSRGDVVLLGALRGRGAVRPGRLAARLGCGPATVSRRAARLEPEGLVVRRPDPADERAEPVEPALVGGPRPEGARTALARRPGEDLPTRSAASVREAERLVRDLAERLLHAPARPAPGPPRAPDAPVTLRPAPETDEDQQ